MALSGVSLSQQGLKAPTKEHDIAIRVYTSVHLVFVLNNKSVVKFKVW